MSLTESSLNVTEKTDNSTSPLDKNLWESNLDISGVSEVPSILNTNDNDSISITLDTVERDMLDAKKAKQGLQSQQTEMEDSVPNDGIELTESCMQLTLASNEPSMDTVELENETTERTDSELMESMAVQDSESELFQHGFLELGRRLWKSMPQMQHYTKGCLWSPDGTCILVPVHLDGMHVIELPTDLYTPDTLSTQRNVSSLNSAVHVKESGTVYDVDWYPFMNSQAPETCCWLASRQHEPIHMWDAFSGELRCSYRAYDDVDEIECAISVKFSNDGQNVIGGYKKSIKIFDTNIPGRVFTTIPAKQAVSCFAFSPSNDDAVTTGSWNGYINHYDLRASNLGSLFTLGGHNGGITWLRYAANNSDQNWLLFSGARKDNKILQWDMRNYTNPVREFKRTVNTNQRIYFDLSRQQQWLASGDTDGTLHFWHLSDENADMKVTLHNDCCNGVNFHPTHPILVTSSGQYHFTDVTNEEQQPSAEKIVDYENSLLLLWFGKSQQEL